MNTMHRRTLVGALLLAVTLGGCMTKSEAEHRVGYARKYIEPKSYKWESRVWRLADPVR